MPADLIHVCVALTAVALALYAAGIWATHRQLGTGRPRRVSDACLPPLTVLKPLKGMEQALEANLRSLLQQRYPGELQIVFASTEPADPALAFARRLASRYPHVRCDFVISDPAFGHNPKVANLQGALSVARHDRVLQADANVHSEPGLLEHLVREMEGEQAAMVTGIVVGEGERSFAAALENLQLTAFTGPATCLASQLAGVTCVIGKCMLFRRSAMDAVGGLDAVKDVLAEDFVLGDRLSHAGEHVVLSSSRARNINVDNTLAQVASRHARWLKMRATVHAPGFIADILPNPTLFATLALLASGCAPAYAWLLGGVVLLKSLGDDVLLRRLRGHSLVWHHRGLSPVRDLLLAGIWLYALFSRHVEWRGARFRLGRGSRLQPVRRRTTAPAFAAEPRVPSFAEGNERARR